MQQSHTNTGTLQTITGQFEADFPDTKNPGNFLRYPYKSIEIKSLNFFGFTDIDFDSEQGGTSPVNSLSTCNRSGIRIVLKKGTTSGTYRLSDVPGSAFIKADYKEMEFIGDGFFLRTHKTIDATLDLNVSNDGTHYTSDNLRMTVATSQGNTLDIEAKFDIYLSFG